MKAEELAKTMVNVIRAYFAKAMPPVLERIKNLEDRKPQRGNDGEPGAKGESGLDAWQIDIIDPDTLRSYPRGTYASWRGGIIRALHTTEPLEGLADDESPEKRGWTVIVCGISGFSMKASEDGRTFTARAVLTTGKAIEQKAKTPGIIYRGIWREGLYVEGDATTFGGSLFVAERDTARKPETENSGWRLAVKRGRDGKDGKDGERGERGQPGERGRDLTQMSFEGIKT